MQEQDLHDIPNDVYENSPRIHVMIECPVIVDYFNALKKHGIELTNNQKKELLNHPERDITSVMIDVSNQLLEYVDDHDLGKKFSLYYTLCTNRRMLKEPSSVHSSDLFPSILRIPWQDTIKNKIEFFVKEGSTFKNIVEYRICGFIENISKNDQYNLYVSFVRNMNTGTWSAYNTNVCLFTDKKNIMGTYYNNSKKECFYIAVQIGMKDGHMIYNNWEKTKEMPENTLFYDIQTDNIKSDRDGTVLLKDFFKSLAT